MTIARNIARAVGSSVRAGRIGPEGGITGQFSATIYDSTVSLPTTGISAGAQAYVSSNQRLYIRGTGGWYNIATINNNPTFNSVQTAGGDSSPFILASDGTTTTVVTLNVTDSEGFPVTFSVVTDVGFDSIATVSQDSSVFTITPLSEDSAGTATSGTLTFKASDGVNIASEVATFELTFRVPNSDLTTLLIKSSGNNGTNTSINDASSSNNSITITGDASAQAFSPHHPAGYSFEVVGNTDLIAIDSGYFTTNSTWWKSSGFTIEGWVNLISNDNTAIFDNRTSSTQGFMINYNNTSGKISFYAGSFIAFSNSLSRDGKWHYIALTVSGTSANLYIDGVRDSTTATVPNTSTYDYFGQAQNTLGAVQYTPRQSNACEGFYRDFKFTAGVEYSADTMTVPTSRLNSDSNTALFVTMSPFPRDISSNASTVTTLSSTNNTFKNVVNNPYIYKQYSASNDGASVYFDGNDDLRTTGYTGPIGTGDYTVECWVYPTARNTNGAWVFQIQDGHAPSNANGIQVYYRNNSSGYKWAHLTNNTQHNTTTASFLNMWQHVALTRASGTTRLFINGVVIDTQTSDTYDASSYDDITVAKGYSNRALTGYISDFRVINGTALYTSAFTPPFSPLTAVTNTKYLTCNDAPNIFNAAGTSNNVKLNGDVKSSTASTKYASASISLDGTGDMIEIGDDTNLDFGSEDFTIEGWYKAAATNSDHYLISSSGGSFNAGPSHFGINIYQGNWRVGGFNDKLIGGVGSGVNTGIDTTTWHHFAWTQNNRKIQFFVDGVQTGSTVDVSSDTFDCDGSFKIGSFHNGNQSNWNGNLEDIRISKGLSRYPFILPRETLTLSDHANTKLIACHAASTTTDGAGIQTITANGTPSVKTLSPHPRMTSVYFDGNDDALRTNDNTTLSMGTGDFTIEAWIRPDNTSTAYRAIISDNLYGSSGSWCIYQYGTKLYVASDNNAISTLGGSGNTVLSATTWSHIAFTRASGTARLFHNGIQVGSDTSLSTNFTDDQIVIGANNHSSGYPAFDYIGYISNVRVIKGTAIYNKTFTPPTSELTA